MLRTIFYYAVRMLLKIYFFIYHRTSVRGARELYRYLRESGGPVILASNHESYLDPPLIGAFAPCRLRFIAWEHLFDSPLLRAIITPLGAVPVSHENKTSAASLLREVIGFLDDGISVLIFPEGQRTTDGRLQPLEGGVALMSVKSGAPIVPVWLDGPYRAYPPHRGYPLPKKLTITFGSPISADDMPEEMSEKDRRRALLEALRSSFERMRDEIRAERGEDIDAPTEPRS